MIVNCDVFIELSHAATELHPVRPVTYGRIRADPNTARAAFLIAKRALIHTSATNKTAEVSKTAV